MGPGKDLGSFDLPSSRCRLFLGEEGWRETVCQELWLHKWAGSSLPVLYMKCCTSLLLEKKRAEKEAGEMARCEKGVTMT